MYVRDLKKSLHKVTYKKYPRLITKVFVLNMWTLSVITFLVIEGACIDKWG